MVLREPAIRHERPPRILAQHLVDKLVEFALRAHPPIMNDGYDIGSNVNKACVAGKPA